MVVPADAQTLADVARQEADRRSTVESGRAFTNEDLGQEPESASVTRRRRPAGGRRGRQYRGAEPGR